MEITDDTEASGRELKLKGLRQQHPRFIYDGFSVEQDGERLRASFSFLLEPDIRFEPAITIKPIAGARFHLLDPRLVEHLFFHLGLVEMLSYWKAACSPEIVVRAGSLNPRQVAWWKDLLIHGMGEFFYVNRIDFRDPDFVRITVDHGDRKSDYPYHDGATQNRALVLTSGGKDSALTLQLLKEAGAEFNCIMLNPTSAASDLVAASGRESPLVVRREIDHRLLELNSAGYLNGHTPFSAYLAFLGLGAAVIWGYDRVIVSNERSSNEGNVEFLGAEINHQYSKTYRFEERFRDYVKEFITDRVHYFSLLRPLYEMQIIRLFAEYPAYFSLFKSCNRKQFENSWCGRCPKCVSIFALFYPFLEAGEITEIFGSNFFDREESIPLLRQLTGSDAHKPFECVGTLEETIGALHLGLERARRGERLPVALAFAGREILPRYPRAAEYATAVLGAWGSEHGLPPEYEAMIKARLERVNSDK